MSLRPEPLPPIPAVTVAVVRAAFPKGNLYVDLRAEFGPAGAFKQKGTVSLWKNAFATPSTYFLMGRTGFLVILQYSQN